MSSIDKNWDLQSNQFNFRPITDSQITADMITLRAKLASTGVKFKEMVGSFRPLAGFLSPSCDIRWWGNNTIQVFFTRDYDLMVLGVCRGGVLRSICPNFILTFEKPANWDDSIHLEPATAGGELPELLELADLLLQEWPNCHKLKPDYSQLYYA